MEPNPIPTRRRPSRVLTLPAVTVAALVLLLVTLGRADAPEGHYSTQAESVVDGATGLHWQRNATGVLTWADAVLHCENFNAELQNNWRLPSMKELQTLVDEANTSGTLIDSVFTGTDGADWTSSEVLGDPTSVYVVNIGGSGDAVPQPKIGGGVARCVRP